MYFIELEIRELSLNASEEWKKELINLSLVSRISNHIFNGCLLTIDGKTVMVNKDYDDIKKMVINVNTDESLNTPRFAQVIGEIDE